MEPWRRVLVLSVGGALGVNARYWLGIWMARWADPRFPWATFAINVTGSFAIGFLSTLLTARFPHPTARLLVLVGFLGGYTTFSTFTFDSFVLWERGDVGLSLANTFGSVAAGLVAVVLGVVAARGLIGLPPGPAPAAATAVDAVDGSPSGQITPWPLPSDPAPASNA